MKTELYPAAQAVLDAAFPVYDDEHLYVATGEQHAGMIAAAALRAAADQVVPIDRGSRRQCNIRAALIAIAAELGGHQ